MTRLATPFPDPPRRPLALREESRWTRTLRSLRALGSLVFWTGAIVLAALVTAIVFGLLTFLATAAGAP